jgi:hypothetical protein
MSTTGKVVLGIVVLVIVLGGGYYYYAHSKMATVGMNATSTSMDGMAMDGMASRRFKRFRCCPRPGRVFN